MATADIINMNDQAKMDHMSKRDGDPGFVEHSLRPKGHAIPGIDYKLDLMSDEKETGQAPAQPQPQGQSQQRPSGASTGMRPRSLSLGTPGSSRSPGNPMMNPMGGYGAESIGSDMGMGIGMDMSMPESMEGQRYGQPDSVGMGMGMQMPGFASVPMDAQSMSGSVAGAGFADSGLLGHMPESGMMEPELSYEERRRRKTDALANLARLESQGYSPAGKKGSHTTELAELEAMVDKLTEQRNLDNSIKYQRKILVGFATMLESVCENEDYNIFELDLEGWSESLYENISDYDEVFEELYLKYKDVAKIPPELKLVTMVAGSAWMYHMSRNMFGKAASKVPGFDEVMKFDPDLKKHYQQSASALAQQRGIPVPDRKKDKSNFNFLGQMFGVNQTPDMAPPPATRPRGPTRFQERLPRK